MPTRRLVFSTVVLTATAVSQPETGKKLPFLGAPPEELQVLAPLVGQWTTKWDVRPSLQEKDGYTADGEATGHWLHNRHFIRVEGTAISDKHRLESTDTTPRRRYTGVGGLPRPASSPSPRGSGTKPNAP